MKVRCIFNTGESLSRKTIEAGSLRTSEYPISIGREYVVYSMFIWKGCLKYLLVESADQSPSWYPAELFEVFDHLLSPIWYFTFEKDKNPVAMWGYKEMIYDPKHYIDLIEYEPAAF